MRKASGQLSAFSGQPERAAGGARPTVAAPEVLTRKKTATPWLSYQRDWMNDDSPLKLGEKSRRIGWTYAESFDATSRRFRPSDARNVDYWFSSADESASAEFIEYCRFWAKDVFTTIADYFTEQVEDPKTGRTAVKFCIRCPNGRRITAMSSNPRRFRSKGGDVCLDEYAYHDDAREMYRAAQPSTIRGGWMRIFSTHNGEACEFNRMVQQARKILVAMGYDPDRPPANIDYATIKAKARELHLMPLKLHRVTLMDAVAAGLVENINEYQGTKLNREDFIADCRATCIDEDMWNQEFMCVPSIDTVALLSYAIIEACEHEDCVGLGNELAGYQGGPLFVGVDVGRTGDRTAIWADEMVGDVAWARQVKLIAKMSLPEQQRILAAVIRSGKTAKVCIDKTGIGLGLYEWTAKEFGEYLIEGVQFTSAEQHALAIGMQQTFEDKKTRIPANCSEVREQLHKVRKVVTIGGATRYEAPRDKTGHADVFWAKALAIRAAGAAGAVWDGTLQRVVKGSGFGVQGSGDDESRRIDRRAMAGV